MLKQWLNRRAVVLVVGILAVAALAYLAAGLANFQFEPPREFGLQLSSLPKFQLASETPAALNEQILFWLALILAVGLILSILNPEARRLLINALLRVGVTLVLIYIISNYYSRQEVLPENVEAVAAGRSAAEGAQAAPPVFVQPEVPPGMVYLVTLAILLGIMGFSYWTVSRVAGRRKEEAPLDELASIARTAIADLQAGADWEDAVVQCYVRMNTAVAAARGLQRQAGMTPAEFAGRLERAGLPGSAVRRLTSLFENVRYGAKPATAAERADAVACLSAIVQACEGAR